MNEEHHSHIFSDQLEAEQAREIKRAWNKVQFARTLLFIVIGFSVWGFVTMLKAHTDYLLLACIIVYIFTYFTSKKRPYTNLIIASFPMGGMVLYNLLLMVTNIPLEELFREPEYIIILVTIGVRAIVLAFIIRGVVAAKKWEELARGKFH